MIGVLLILAGAAVVVTSFLKIAPLHQQNQWRCVDGDIVSSDIGFDGEHYEPNVGYEYTIDGAIARGTQIRSLLVKFNWKGPSEKICAKYPVGRKVKVFVDPMDSSRAVLEPGGAMSR